MSSSFEDLPEPPRENFSPEELENFFEELLFHYLLRREEGESPDIDLYLARYPDHAERIAALILGHDAAPVVLDEPGTTTRGRRRRWQLDRLGPYKIRVLAASTARGHVYRARHEEQGIEVALKVLRRVDRMDPRELERFRREARTVARMGVDGVVPVLDLGEDEGSVYYAMPWVEGATIAELIDVLRGERLPGIVDPATLDLEARSRLFVGYARILAQVHDRGVLHRDIKPSNLMVGARGEPLVLDFGVARDLEDSGLTRTSDPPLGTPLYLAPELLTGESDEAQVASEVFSLAAALWEFLSLSSLRRHADRSEFFADVDRAVPRLSNIVPGSGAALERFLTRALSRRPAERFQDMKTFADALEAAAAGGAERWAGRTGLVVLILVSLLLLLAAGLFFASR